MRNKEPAFPRDHAADGHNGMTLRDYFAAKAMLGFIAEPVDGVGEALFYELSDKTCVAIADAAYAMADAMMAARVRA